MTGTFWQPTQPVSGPLTDAQLRASPVSVSGTFWQPVQPVSGTVAVSNFPVTQAVSAATLPLPTGAATEATLATIGRPSPLCVSVTAASGAAAAATLPAAGVGLFHYITHVRVEIYATNNRSGGAIPVVVTTTNLPGALAYTFETAQQTGTMLSRVTELGGSPMKSSVANTPSTIAAPATANALWRIAVHYFAAA